MIDVIFNFIQYSYFNVEIFFFSHSNPFTKRQHEWILLSKLWFCRVLQWNRANIRTKLSLNFEKFKCFSYVYIDVVHPFVCTSKWLSSAHFRSTLHMLFSTIFIFIHVICINMIVSHPPNLQCYFSLKLRRFMRFHRSLVSLVFII